MTTTTTTARRIAIALAAGAVALAGLSACAPLVVGGAAVAAGGMVATDRRSSGAQVDDQAIELRGAARIREIANDNMNVTVTSFNRQVLLTGTVGSEADKRRAEEAIRRMDNVRNVVNEVVVGPGSSFPDRSNDVFITGKVKASLLDQNDIFANSFKVVTERGIVYLMGIATRAETDRATEVARNTSGVQKVVRIVEIISDQELANLKAQQPLSSMGGSGASASSSSSSSSGAASSTAPASSSSSRVPLPPMEPLPGSSSSAPASGGVVTTPIR